MSASLVGSEMCIRDSPQLHGLALRALHFARPPPGLSVGPEATGAFRLAAVSYTHLTLPTICSV
eukprot:6479791-Alexandrium_andersonii.AAC.1